MSTQTIDGIGTVQFTRFPTNQAVVDAYEELIRALKEIMYKDVNAVSDADGKKLIDTMNKLKALAKSGVTINGSSQYVTTDMMRQIDLLNRSLVSVGIDSNAGRVDVLRWKDMGIDGFDALLTRAGTAVDTNRSLQALVEQEYIRTANEILSGQLESLHEALSATKASIEILTDLQNEHNPIEPKDLTQRLGIFSYWLPEQERTKSWNTAIYSVLTAEQKNAYSNYGYVIDSADKLMTGNGGVPVKSPLYDQDPFAHGARNLLGTGANSFNNTKNILFGARFQIAVPNSNTIYRFTPDEYLALRNGPLIGGASVSNDGGLTWSNATNASAVQALFNAGYFGDPVELANQGKDFTDFYTKPAWDFEETQNVDKGFTFDQYRALLDSLGWSAVPDSAINRYIDFNDTSAPDGVNIPWILATAVYKPITASTHVGGGGGNDGGWGRSLQADRDKAFMDPIEIKGGTGTTTIQEIIKNVTLARVELAKQLAILDKLTPPGPSGRDPNTLAGKIAAVLEDLQTYLGDLPIDFTNLDAQAALISGIQDWLVDNQNASSGTAGADKAGDIQRHLTEAMTAATNLNDKQKEDFRRFMFIFEEYYKSATAILSKLNQIIERMAQNAGR